MDNNVTIHDVAALARVSISTVSRVLTGKAKVSEKSRKLVMDAIHAVGYVPNRAAQMIKNGKPLKVISLVIPNVTNVVFPIVIKTIEETALQNGYMMILCNTEENPEREEHYINSLVNHMVSGFIFMTPRTSATKLIDLHEQGIPVVSLNRHSPGKTDAVILDNYEAGYKTADYLLSRGLKNIAYLDGSSDLHLYIQRFAGSQARLAESGKDFFYVKREMETIEEGYNGALDMLDSGCRPDAIIAGSDLKAFGILKALSDRKVKIPEEISVISFDDLEMSKWVNPSLTTIAQPFEEMGRIACKRLIERINSKEKLPTKTFMTEGKLIIRNSVI